MDSNPWSKAKASSQPASKGKGKAKEKVGRTFRAPRAHATRTSEKNPGVLTKLPAELYYASSPGGRATMRAHNAQELVDLAEEDAREERKEHVHLPREEPRGVGSPEQGAGGPSGVRYNKRGRNVPDASPEGLLTADRDGSERAKILVSPVSYGRTRRAIDTAAPPPAAPRP